MIKSLFFILLFGSLLLNVSCSDNDREKFKDREEPVKEPTQIVEPFFDTTLPGEEGVKNTIKAYNFAVRNALMADPYLKILRKYATEKEVQRVFVDIEFDTLKNVAMRSWQRKLAFDNVSTSEDSASVDTTETWEFEYVDLKTKEVVESKKTVRYKLKYTLGKEDDRWVVSKVKERESSVVTQTVDIPLKNIQR